MPSITETRPAFSPGYPEPRTSGGSKQRLNVIVVFTAVEPTLAALRTAGALACQLNMRITLVVPHVVPYPLPLSRSPVPLGWMERHFRVLAAKCPVEVAVRIYLCRDRMEMLFSVLALGSLVVIGGRKRWWPVAEKRLARELRRAGHEVIYTETHSTCV